MSDSTQQQQQQRSHFHFQMWDKHLTLLNKIWDLESTRVSMPESELSEQPPWNQQLVTLNQSWHVSPELLLPAPTSLLGKLLLPFKKQIIRWIQPAIDALIQRQNDYNARIVQSLNALNVVLNVQALQKIEAQKEFNARAVQTINGLVESVDAELAELKTRFDAELAELKTRFDELQTMIWTFDRRKEALEIDQILLNQKLEQLLSTVKDGTQKLSADSKPEPLDQGKQHDYSYFVFENLYRGDEMTLKERQKEYIPYFQNCTNVLDIGCGRGEFLELLRDHNITGYGVDMNQTMIRYCQKKGLRVEEADVFSHLESLPDNALDGIFTAQMVEHCSPQQVFRLFKRCFEKLRHQKYLVVETQNPTSLYALSHFYRDMSHEKPFHPDALVYLLKTIGFQDVRVEYKSPFSQAQGLQELDTTAISDDTLRARVETLNTNIRQLNQIIYGYLDYAVIAKKVKMF